MEERSELEMSSVETQLLSLYTERELLERELGTADPDELVGLVRRLEQQLETLGTSLSATPPGCLEASPSPSPADADRWAPVLARVGGDHPADVLSALDELEIRLVAAQLQLAAPISLPASAPLPNFAAHTVPAHAALTPSAAPSAAPSPLGELASGLRLLVGELTRDFERAELVFEGESAGARWSVRCSNGTSGASAA